MAGDTWNDEMVAIATQMRQEGFSAAKIAERIGRTRFAVIGKLRRRGVRAYKHTDWIEREDRRERASFIKQNERFRLAMMKDQRA